MELRYHIQDIDNIAAQLVETYPTVRIFVFEAEMGSGKTTLISALCKQLDALDIASSPTFAIVNEYALRNGGRAYHMDWYRLKHAEDAFEAGVADILKQKDVYIFIEWPQIAESLLEGNDYVKIKLELLSETERKLITIA